MLGPRDWRWVERYPEKEAPDARADPPPQPLTDKRSLGVVRIAFASGQTRKDKRRVRQRRPAKDRPEHATTATEFQLTGPHFGGHAAGTNLWEELTVTHECINSIQ